MNKNQQEILEAWASHPGYKIFTEYKLKALEGLKIKELKDINIIKVQQGDADETNKIIKTQAFLDALYAITHMIDIEARKTGIVTPEMLK